MQGVEEVQTIQNRKWNTSFGIENLHVIYQTREAEFHRDIHTQ